MNFIPQNRKYKKSFKANKNNFNNKTNLLCFGEYGLKALTKGKLNSKQLESLRRFLSKNVKKNGGFFLIRGYPYIPVTKKPVEVRMGKGKGNVSFWVYPLNKGQIFIEIGNLNEEKSKEILEMCKDKIPFSTKIIFYNKNDLSKK